MADTANAAANLRTFTLFPLLFDPHAESSGSRQRRRSEAGSANHRRKCHRPAWSHPEQVPSRRDGRSDRSSQSMTNMRDLLMGIDVGTTNVRCALYDLDAQFVTLASQPTSVAYRLGGQLDADALWAITAETCAEAVAAAREHTEIRVRGAAVASIGCVPVLLDEAAIPYAPVVADEARFAACMEQAASTSPAEFSAITGYPLDVLNAAFLVAALSQADKARARFVLSVADWIAFKLTGTIAHDYSTALSYALWDYRIGSWWAEYLEGIGLDPAIFGVPMDSGQPIGTFCAAAAEQIGLPRTTPVFTGGHDYLTAALAADLHPGAEVLNVTGTIEIMASVRETLDGMPRDGAVRAMRDRHVVSGQSSYMIEALGAGHVEWFRSAVLAQPGAESPTLGPYFAALETLPPAYAATRELFIPFPYGGSLPASETRKTGAFLGVGPTSSGLTLFRSMIEGLCFQARQMLEQQRNVLGSGGVVVKSVGGGSRSAAWVQIKANVLGMPIHVPRILEASALGAALLAGVGAGVYGGFEEAGAAAAALGVDVIHPMNDQSERYVAVFREAYLPAIADLTATDARMAAVLDRQKVMV
jgi:xylulokinase